MYITKAVLTGGGRATRLRPLTATLNKHLLPLANKPMIFHAIEKVAEAGITDIFINTNPGETELQAAVGDGGRWGVRIQFFEQRGGPQGIAHVVNEAREFIGDDPFMFYLSDNILLGGVKEMVEDFSRGDYDCMLALSKVKDPERFGVPVFDEQKNLIDVWEKPAVPPNTFAVTGIYLYGPKAFFDAFEHTQKSARGEYEISSVHSYFLRHGYRVGYREITGWWKDTGKPDDLLLANQLLLDMMAPKAFSAHGVDLSSAAIRGNVSVGEGTVIGKGVTLLGPAVIGERCVLEDCTIGPYVSLGAGGTARGAAIERSILLDGVQVEGRMHLAACLVGKEAVIRTAGGSLSGTQRMIVGDKTVVEW